MKEEARAMEDTGLKKQRSMQAKKQNSQYNKQIIQKHLSKRQHNDVL